MDNTNTESVELFYLDKDDKEIPFTVYIRKPSMAARVAILDIAGAYTEVLQAIDERYPELHEYNETTLEQLPAKILKIYYKKIKDVKMSAYEHTIKYFQAIITTKQLTTVQQEFIKEEFNAKFWLMQDIIEIEKAVMFFRGINQV